MRVFHHCSFHSHIDNTESLIQIEIYLHLSMISEIRAFAVHGILHLDKFHVTLQTRNKDNARKAIFCITPTSNFYSRARKTASDFSEKAER